MKHDPDRSRRAWLRERCRILPGRCMADITPEEPAWAVRSCDPNDSREYALFPGAYTPDQAARHASRQFPTLWGREVLLACITKTTVGCTWSDLRRSSRACLLPRHGRASALPR